MKIAKYLVLILFLVRFNILFSQSTLDNEVNVIKAYIPAIPDANKIDILPKIVDTVITAPTFNYLLDVRQYNTIFNLEPIQAAKMIGEPLTKLYHDYARVGYGNYNTFLFDYNFSTLRSKQSLIGINAHHLSSDGKIKLSNETRVNSGYSDNQLEIFGKRFFKTSTLYGNVGYSNNMVHYYGYNTDIDTSINQKQIFTLLTASCGLTSNYPDTNHLNYKLKIHIHYFQDDFQNSENATELSGNFFKKYFGQLFGADAKIDYFGKNIESLAKIDNTIITVDPWVKLFYRNFEITAGIDMTSDISPDSANSNSYSHYHFYPHLKIEYNIIDNILVPYAGFGGKLEPNYFEKNYSENPYLVPGTYIRNTNYNSIIFGGLRGNLSSKISYNLQIKWANIFDMYFYVNDTLDKAQNKFNVVYDDDITLMNYYGEIAFKKSDKLYFLLKGNISTYSMNKELEPWHTPEYQVSLTTRYNIGDKIITSLDVFGIGRQYAKTYGLDDTGQRIVIAKELRGTVDANIGIEYRYNKNLSAFINCNNIGAVKYYQWNNYPTQRFNLLGGLTYSF